jgi:hypothetical protein
MILRDVVDLIHSNFEVYSNGYFCGEFDFKENYINNGSYEWILDSKVSALETEAEPKILVYITD